MRITRTDPITGKENTIQIPVTDAQLGEWRGGRNIQDAMSHLTDDQREFIMTGIMPDTWEDIFKDHPGNEEGNKEEPAF